MLSRRMRIFDRIIGLKLADVRPAWKTGSVLLIATYMLSACASTHRPAIESRTPESQADVDVARDSPRYDAELRIRAEVAEWAGVPHVLGGTSVRGIDCSAFVQQVYASAFDVRLPRTTREQALSGMPVQRRDLSAGDLVFFTPPTTSRHVGIYLDDGQFAHASSSEGVMISRLDETYWERAYWTSRRILPESTGREVAPSVREADARSRPASFTSEGTDRVEPSRRRTGW